MTKQKLFMRAGSAAIIALLAAGCSHGKTNWGPVGDFVEGIVGPIWEDENPSTGSGKVTIGDQLEKVDLLTLLDPEGRRREVCRDLGGDTASVDNVEIQRDSVGGMVHSETINRSRKLSRKERRQQEESDTSRDIQCAFAAFYTYTETCAGENAAKESVNRAICLRQNQFSFSGKNAAEAAKNLALIIRRNQVQDEIIATSENVCRRFKISLNDQITKTNFSLGSSVATLAGLGAIFTDATTSRSLSGAAAIVSGIRAEYNEAYLQSLTVSVVTKGIDAKRKDILDEINGSRYGPPFLESAQEIEYFDPLYFPIDINKPCIDKKSGNQKECSVKEIETRILVNEKRMLLFEKYADGDRRKAVRYASRPYIPLSPYDKITVALQEEFERELVEKKRELRKLQTKLADVKGKISTQTSINTNAASNEQEADTAEKAKITAQANEKTALIAGKEQQIKELTKQIEDAKKENRPGGRKRAHDLGEEKKVLLGEVASLKAERALLSAPAEAASIGGDAVNSCKSESDKSKSECVELVKRIGEVKAACNIVPPPAADKEKCDAFNTLTDEEQLQCVAGSKLADEKKASCRTSGLSRNDTAAPATAQAPEQENQNQEAKATTTTEAVKSVLGTLKSEEQSLVSEITALSTRIGKLEEMFGGELAKVDALVGVVPISQYTVEMAVRDAIRYHAACTIPAGLEKAADSVEKIQSPGFDTVSQGLDNMINLQKKMNTLEKLRKEGATNSAAGGASDGSGDGN